MMFNCFYFKIFVVLCCLPLILFCSSSTSLKHKKLLKGKDSLNEFQMLHKDMQSGLAETYDGVHILTVKGNWFDMGYQITYTHNYAKMVYNNALFFRKYIGDKAIMDYYEGISKYIKKDLKQYMSGMAKGISERLNCTLDEAWNSVIVWNVIFDIFNLRRGCTGFAMSLSQDESYLVHNTDQEYGGRGFIVIYIPDDSYAYASFFGPQFAGVVLGMNEEKIAITYNACPQTRKRSGLPALLMARRVMKEASSLQEAIRMFTDWTKQGNTFGASPAIFIVTDFKTNEMARIEVSSEEVSVTYGSNDLNGRRRILATNHYLAMPSRYPYLPFSSCCRLYRLEYLLDHLQNPGLYKLVNIMADHNGAIEGNRYTICVHSDKEEKNRKQKIQTQFLTIFDNKDNIYWTIANPCKWLNTKGYIPFVNWIKFAHGDIEESLNGLPVKIERFPSTKKPETITSFE